ncbi:MAG: hypothetical protein E7662_10195 [Ruminococcaceae bacterium]|nr:hypothetical protein [Oscillospiraceae bacterium]
MAISTMRNRVPRCGAVCLLLCILSFVFCAPARAADAGPTFYASRFGEYTSLRDTGVYMGTASGKTSSVKLSDGALYLTAPNGEKSYLLLPDPAKAPDTYVIEFVFRFTEIASSNGYLGFLLSSQGDAPSGRTELIFRANGTIDGYSREISDIQKKASAAGEEITVRILVHYGYMTDFRLSVAGVDVAGSAPDKLVQVNPAGWGFVLRNASAEILSVRAVSGDYGALSKAGAAPNYMAPAGWQMPELAAPPTGDPACLLAAVCVLSAAAARKLRVGK